MEWLKDYLPLLTPASFVVLAIAWMYREPISSTIRSLGGRKEIARQIAAMHTEMKDLSTRLEAHIMAEERTDQQYVDRFGTIDGQISGIGRQIADHGGMIQSLRESNIEFRIVIAKNHEDVMRAIGGLTAQFGAVVQRLDHHLDSHTAHA